MAELLPMLLASVFRDVDRVPVALAQDALGAAITAFQALVAEARRERAFTIARDPDSQPLARTLTRIRNDFVMIGRATVDPFPEAIASRLAVPLNRFTDEATAFLRGSAAALAARRPVPLLARMKAALDAYGAEIASIRSEGLMRAMATADVERLFALGFALEQLGRDLADLAPRIQEHAERGRTRERS